MRNIDASFSLLSIWLALAYVFATSLDQTASQVRLGETYGLVRAIKWLKGLHIDNVIF